jgi:hypothetical protein
MNFQMQKISQIILMTNRVVFLSSLDKVTPKLFEKKSKMRQGNRCSQGLGLWCLMPLLTDVVDDCRCTVMTILHMDFWSR